MAKGIRNIEPWKEIQEIQTKIMPFFTECMLYLLNCVCPGVTVYVYVCNEFIVNVFFQSQFFRKRENVCVHACVS